MAPPYHIRAFGDLQIFDGEEIVRLPLKHHYALLVFLAYHKDRRIRRDTLLPLLWPDRPERLARHSLSQTIYGLRIHLPRLMLDAGRDAITLSGAGITADFDESHESYYLRHFAAGDFLDEFTLGGRSEFDSWRDAVAAAFRLRYLSALRESIDRNAGVSDWSSVISLSTKYLLKDPFDEAMIRQHVFAVATHVSGSAALQTLDQRITRLVHDTGREPQKETETLRRRLVAGALATSTVSSGGDDVDCDLPFVGRDAEFALLKGAFHKARDGHGSVATVVGEAGIGKTRLCERLLRFGIISGARVLAVKGYSGERQLTFGVLGRLVMEPSAQAEVSQLPEPARAALQQMLPFAEDSRRSIGSDSSDCSSLRYRLSEAFLALVRRLSASQPLIVFVDDLQLADSSSVQTLAYVARRTQADQILLLWSLRPDELRDNQSVQDLVVELQLRDLRIQLGDLAIESASALFQLAADRFGVNLQSPAEVRLSRLAGGHPYYIIECCRHAALLKADPNRASGALDRIGLPATIVQLLSGRLEKLSAVQWKIVASLVVAGGTARVRTLMRIANVQIDEALDAVVELLAAHLLTEVDCDSVRIAHDLLCEATYQRITAPERAVLHLRCATVLRRLHEGQPAVLATHYYRGGDHANAFRFCLEAADIARKFGSYSEVEHYLKLAADSAVTAGDTYQVERRLGLLLCELRRFDDALCVFDRMRDQERFEADDVVAVSAQLAQVCVELGRGGSRSNELLERARSVARHAQSASDELVFVRVLRTLLSIAHAAGDIALIAMLLDEISEMALSSSGLIAAELFALSANVGCIYREAMVAVNHGERAVTLAEAAAAPSTLVTTLLARGIARLTAGLLRDAQTDFERALKLAETAELWAYRSQIETNLGIVYIEVAEYDMAERCLLSALDVAGKHDSVFVWANLGALYWQTERWDDLRDAGYQLLLLSENEGTSWGICVAESFKGLAALSLQLTDEAAVASRRVIELLGSNIRIADVSYGAIFLARIEAGRSLQDAIRRLECFKETLGAASILSRLRIDLEIANLCADGFPDRGWAIASAVRAVAAKLGASSISIRADRYRDACRYVS